jgi:hypothetical protein
MTRRPPRTAKRATPPPLAVYDGQRCIGKIEDRGYGRIVAYAITEHSRVKVGTFETRVEAMRAIGGGT